MDVAGEPLIKVLLQRLLMSKEVDLIILCTSIHPNDEVLVDIANKSGFKSFQGSENDKLELARRSPDGRVCPVEYV